MRHDGCGGRAGRAELLTGVEGVRRPVRKIGQRRISLVARAKDGRGDGEHVGFGAALLKPPRGCVVRHADFSGVRADAALPARSAQGRS